MRCSRNPVWGQRLSDISMSPGLAVPLMRSNGSFLDGEGGRPMPGGYAAVGMAGLAPSKVVVLLCVLPEPTLCSNYHPSAILKPAPHSRPRCWESVCTPSHIKRKWFEQSTIHHANCAHWRSCHFLPFSCKACWMRA